MPLPELQPSVQHAAKAVTESGARQCADLRRQRYVRRKTHADPDRQAEERSDACKEPSIHVSHYDARTPYFTRSSTSIMSVALALIPISASTLKDFAEPVRLHRVHWRSADPPNRRL